MDVELSVNMSSPGMGEANLMGPGGDDDRLSYAHFL